MKKKNAKLHLVIISIDALNAQDFDYIKTLPNFKQFIDEGSYVREVESVYPTLTYTCHTSIITGTYPKKHGIHTNEVHCPEVATKQPWYWYEKDIKVPTLFDYTNQAGLTSANVLWPVMAGAPITYNCPEIWSVTGQSYASLYFKYGTKSILPIIAKYAVKFKGKKQPYLDNFVEGVSKQIIVRKKPNLICMHLIELDHVRHVKGLHEPSTKLILNKIDDRIGNIIEATKKAGTYEYTTFVILGDHGTSDFQNIVYLNTLFKQQDLLTVDDHNNIVAWKAYANGCGGSVQIYVHEDSDEESRQKIEDVIGKISVMPDTFIKKSYTRDDVDKLYHLNGNFEFVLEAKDGYVFKNHVTDTIVKNSAEVKNSYIAEHGYLPTHKNLKTMLFAKGRGIKKGVQIRQACIVDGGPTFAKILGLNMENVDGRVIEEILK